MASAIVTAYAVPYGLTQAFAGIFGDRFGKCQAVAATCGCPACWCCSARCRRHCRSSTAARFICAPAAATIVPLGMAYVGDVVPYERRQPVLARFLAGQMLGMITGQIAGGIIGDHFGWRTVFYVLAGVFAFAGLALMSQFAGNPWVKPLRRLPEHRPGLISDYRKLAASAWARFLIVAVFFEGLIFFGAFTYVAADLHTRFGLSFSVVGLVVAGFGIGSVLYAVTVRGLVSLLRGSGLVIGGGIVVMLGYLTLAGTAHSGKLRRSPLPGSASAITCWTTRCRRTRR